MEHGNYIGGNWTPSLHKKYFNQYNPARLSDITGKYAESSPQDADKAIEAAVKAYPGWRALPLLRRQAYLNRVLHIIGERRKHIAETITGENGKTMAESLGEVDSAIKEMEYQIAEGMRMCGKTTPVERAGTLAYSTREPRGPVGIITPWNFPFNVPCRKCAPALMAGNTVVFKPASLTPGVGVAFTQAVHDAGLPDGVFNMVTGPGARVGHIIAGDPRIKAVSFTGSTTVGKSIQQRAAGHLTPCQLELGGKNPAVVLADADLQLAATAIVKASFACAGQWCTSTSRIILQGSISEPFLALLVSETKKLIVGDGRQPQTTMGPVCGIAQKRVIDSYIQTGLGEGAAMLLGDAPSEMGETASDCFIKPVIFTDVTPFMKIAQEEIFGPVLCVIKVDTFQEALDIANGVSYGLSSSIFTKDLKHALTFMQKSEVGLAHVNLMTSYKEPQLEFGGVKESGAGLPEAGGSGIQFFTEHKVCYVRYGD